MPKVSVIIPNYNHALYLRQRIESVLQQSYNCFELIILDDCSTDNSKDIIELYKSHPQVSHIINNEKNSGSTFKQWLKGISLAKGDLIWIAESDDFADNDFLKNMVLPFRNPKIGLVNCQSYKYDFKNEISGTWADHTINIKGFNWQLNFNEDGKAFIEKAMLFQNSIPNASAVIFRRELISNNIIDVEMTLNGDWLFYIKLLSISDFAFIAKPMNYFRYHDNKGSSKNILNFNNIKEYYKILGFVFKNISLTRNKKNEIVKHVYKIWMYQCKNDIFTAFKNNFKKIYKYASTVDKWILARMIKDAFFQANKKFFYLLKERWYEKTK